MGGGSDEGEGEKDEEVLVVELEGCGICDSIECGRQEHLLFDCNAELALVVDA